MREFKKKVMGLKKILDTLFEPRNGKKCQEKTDAAMGFVLTNIARGFSETYSWMHDGIGLITDSIVEGYKQGHDVRMFAKLYQQWIYKKTDFCNTYYINGDSLCVISKQFYDKSFVGDFCNKKGYGPDTEVKIKKRGSCFHRGYCQCSIIPRRDEPKETLINPT